MKKTLCLALAFGVLVGSAHGSTWLTNFEKAKAASAKSKKPILAFFTGSDWCKYCKLLQKDVFATKAFRDWADKKVILLELDYPAKKKQPEALKKQNEELHAQYQPPGFPTIGFMDAKGNLFGALPYMKGGPANWIKEADKQLTRQKKGTKNK